MLEIIILSFTQGLTEFLPISSSAHLILVSKLLNYNVENLSIDLSLHLGSLIAVMLFFKNEIYNFIKNKSLFLKIIIASLPTMVVGYLLLKFNLIDQLRNTNVIALTTVLFGILLYFSDKSKTNKSISSDFTLKIAIYIGLFQTLSLIPGVSRSGITMTGSRYFNFNRIDSAKISFLLSIPTLLIISIYNIKKIIELKNMNISFHSMLAVVFSFLISYLTLKFFVKFLKKFNFTFFVIYRIFLGGLIVLYAYF